ncbi:transporter substrate-binding domain-containing protein [Desulfuromonas thiophila]|uniref:Amino acid ABC transporter substrate-binding protein, PAAT family n=1 Tax=Desulfuromonas thiophila TaxID=57664 RepID=A0A1G7CVM4_9BACT|nr:transporter substrate-binding domain-containing protein [Desulfuromonas thiophila]SDE43378.1 amino acid ABC transporter substrate-binding protein, PAAT family [Desulfuromonas thiophila]
MKKNHVLLFACLATVLLFSPGHCRTLDEIRQEGVLRHLGVPYANFVTGQGDGLSVELIRRFAYSLGVRYEFVPTSWSNVISDLTGQQVKPDGDQAIVGAVVPVRGDLIANGLTVLPWRQQVLDFSDPIFPTQVWLVAGANSALQPIRPQNEGVDIAATRRLLAGVNLLGKQNTCLDPALYPFARDNFRTVYFGGNLNELFPAVLQGEADCTLLDVPDALVAISRWPGQVKILGPLSQQQNMAVGFRKDNPQLRQAFNDFYAELRRSGVYRELVRKYYPAVFDYYPDFF